MSVGLGAPPARDLFGPGQTVAIRDLLQSIFATELVSPGRRLWLNFGWISDVEILDNRGRQFAALCPDWASTWIRFHAFLEAYLERGGNVVLVIRDVEHNLKFVEKIERLRTYFPENLKVHADPDVHEKGILGDDFLLSGSMNLTYNGIAVKSEHVTLRTDPASVEEWRMTFEEKWGWVLE